MARESQAVMEMVITHTVAEVLGLMRRVAPESEALYRRLETAISEADSRGEASAGCVGRHKDLVVVEIGIGSALDGDRLLAKKMWGGKFPAALLTASD